MVKSPAVQIPVLCHALADIPDEPRGGCGASDGRSRPAANPLGAVSRAAVNRAAVSRRAPSGPTVSRPTIRRATVRGEAPPQAASLRVT